MLHQLLKRTLTEEPDRQLLEFHGRFWTATELEEAACRLAASLMEAGVEAIDRVGVLLPNCPETVLAYLACFKANFVIVPLDYRHRPAQIGYALSHSGANVLLVHRDRVAELEAERVLAGVPHVVVVGARPADRSRPSFADFVSRDASARFPEDYSGGDLCVMIYTSGTTSRPKGVTLTRNAMVAGIRKYLACVPLNKEDAALVAAPITRPMALRSQLLPVLYVGGRVCLIEQFAVDEYLAALRRPPAKTYLALLPAALGQLLAHPDIRQSDFSSLRLCMAGGDRVPRQLHEEFSRITGVSITEQCGATEVGAYALNPPFGRKKPGSIGLPMYGAQVCVVDAQGDDVTTNEIGEILVSSPMMMDGYWNDTALTRKTMRDGRVRTGDLGRYDEDGYLWFMGRKKDIIVRGGSNISPLEVETVLLNHPAVAETCVIGVLDPDWGQVVHAYVVLKPGHDVSADELLEFSRSQLAEYMLPERFEFIDEMPVKGPGKIDRDLLRMRAEMRPLIEKVPFFRSASDDFVRDIVPRVVCREFEAADTIVRQGEVGDAMYFLTHGQVEVVLEEGGEQLAVLSEGAYFGEVAILMEVPRTASVRALDDCEVYELKRASVLELVQAYPEFTQHIEESARRLYDNAQ
jgi:long-chain acyl-CoA synthetase